LGSALFASARGDTIISLPHKLFTDEEGREIRSFPIFVVGCPRSGTTLLRHILDSHENIACPPESKFISSLLRALQDPGAVQGLRSMGFEGYRLYRVLRRMIEVPFDLYAQGRRKSRWADKTPNYYRLLDFLDDVFERRVQFVFVIRHPFDCARSCEELFRESGLRFALADEDLATHIERFGSDRFGFLKYWLEVNERLYVFHQLNLARTRFMRYEDLVSHPRPTLVGLFRYLHEEFHENILRRAFDGTHDAGIQDPKFLTTAEIHTRSLLRYRTWPEHERTHLWSLVAPLAERFGYSPNADFTAMTPWDDGAQTPARVSSSATQSESRSAAGMAASLSSRRIDSSVL
jgi:protein-tyrosine sulfotransferase